MSTTKIILKKSSVSSNAPAVGDLDYGEVALNYADGRLYYKNSSNQIKHFIDSDRVAIIGANLQSGILAYADSAYTTPAEVYSLIDSSYLNNKHIDAKTLNGQLGSYYLDYNNLTNVPAGQNLDSDNIKSIFSVSGDLLYDSATGQFSFTETPEITDSEVRALFGASGSLSYNQATGVFSYTERTDTQVRALFNAGGDLSYDSSTGTFSYNTDYYTKSEFDSDFNTRFGVATTDSLGEGSTNLYFTDNRAYTAIDNRVTSGFISGLGVNAITLDSASPGYYLDYTNFTNTPNVLDSANIRNIFSVAGDLAYDSATGQFSYTGRTAQGVRDLFSVSGDLAYDSATGQFSFTQRTNQQVRNLFSVTGDISYDSSTGQFSVTTYKNTDFDNRLATKSTDNLSEGSTNLYYKDSSVRSLLSGGTVVDISISGDLSATNADITGNLNVQGTTTTVNQATLTVSDSKIFLADGNPSDAIDVGIFFNYYDADSLFAGIFRDASTEAITVFDGYNQAIGSTINTNHISFNLPTLKAGEFDGLLNWSNLYNKDSVNFASVTVENLTVTGTQTVNNVASVSTASPLIILNDSATTYVDVGLIGSYYSGGQTLNSGVFHDATDGRWKFFKGSTQQFIDSTYVNTSATGYTLAPVQASEFIGSVAWSNITGRPNTTDDFSEGSINKFYYRSRADSDIGDGHLTAIGLGNNATFSWNNVDHTVDLAYAGTDVTLQIGQEQHMYVKSTEIIPDGTLVMFDSAGFDTIWISKCDPNSVGFDPEKILGITTQDFNSDEAGYITIYGKVRGIDTSAFNEGDYLYMHTSTKGALTNVKPSVGNHVQQIAVVTKKDGVNGSIFVRQDYIPDTDDILEGETNKYYTTARFDSDFADNTTTNLAEGTNQYFTNARARSAISVTDAGGDGSLAYNSGTGVITYTGPSASEVRAHFSQGTGVTITSGQIAIGQDVGTTADVTFNSVTVDSSPIYGQQYGGLSFNHDRSLGDSTETLFEFVSQDSTTASVIGIGVHNKYTHAIGVTPNSQFVFGTQAAATGFAFRKNMGTSPIGLTTGDDLLTIAANTGNTSFKSSTEATTKTSASVTLVGGLGVDKTIRAQDIVVANNITAGTNGTGKFIGGVTGTVSSIANHTTTALAEGTNKYYTTARFDSDLGASTTDDLPQGSTNKYYDSATTTSTARHAISISDNGGDGSITYNATTGVLTYTGPSAAEVRSHFSAGTGVTLTNGQISIGQAVGTNDSVQFSGMTVLNNVVIEGDLYVAGTQTTVSQSTLSVNSSFIHVADSNTDDVVDIGIIGHYSDDGGTTSRHTGFIRDATNGEWYVFDGLIQDTLDSSPPATTINIGGPGWNLPTWNFGRLRGQYLGFDSDFRVFSTNYTVYDSDFTAVSAGRYAVNTTNGQVQCTLPINPTTGDYVKLIDVSNWSGANTVLVNRNGSTIEGYSDNFELDLGQSIVEFIYINNTWNVYSSIGQRGPQGLKGDSADVASFATQTQSIAYAIALG